jgi:hypothetical protein
MGDVGRPVGVVGRVLLAAGLGLTGVTGCQGAPAGGGTVSAIVIKRDDLMRVLTGTDSNSERCREALQSGAAVTAAGRMEAQKTRDLMRLRLGAVGSLAGQDQPDMRALDAATGRLVLAVVTGAGVTCQVLLDPSSSEAAVFVWAVPDDAPIMPAMMIKNR